MTPSACLIASGLFFAVAHATVKFLPHLPASEVVFFRALFSALISFVWLRAAGIRPWGRNKRMLVLRGVFGTLALLLYAHTLQHMPLASAVMGLSTQAAQYYMTRAYQGATAASISALQYLAVIYAIVIGWFIFHEDVTPGTFAGLALIVLSAIAAVRLGRAGSAVAPRPVSK